MANRLITLEEMKYRLSIAIDKTCIELGITKEQFYLEIAELIEETEPQDKMNIDYVASRGNEAK